MPLGAGFVSVLALSCIGSNWDTGACAAFISSGPDNCRHENRDGLEGVCECAEDAPRAQDDEVTCAKTGVDTPAVLSQKPQGGFRARRTPNPFTPC